MQNRIHLDNNIIRIPRDLCKEAKGRRPKINDKIIPINYRLKELLREFTRGLPMSPVFTYRGKPYQRSPKKALRGACERAEIPYGQKVENGVTLKSLRDTFISLALAAGVDYIHVQLMVGCLTTMLICRRSRCIIQCKNIQPILVIWLPRPGKIWVKNWVKMLRVNRCKVVPPAGLEPATPGLGIRCSIH